MKVIRFDDRSTISNNLATNALGNSGPIQIFANALNLSNGSRMQTLTETPGHSGDININVTETMEIAGFSPDGFLKEK